MRQEKDKRIATGKEEKKVQINGAVRRNTNKKTEREEKKKERERKKEQKQESNGE